MPENTRLKNSNFDAVFGELQNVYRIWRGGFENIGLPSIIFIFMVGGVFYYLDTRDWMTLPCCIAPAAIMLACFGWSFISTRRDELRIYENGFTHRSGRKLQTCLWTEIRNCHRRERDNRIITEFNGDETPLDSVEKKNGEIIVFDFEMTGTPEIAARFQSRKS